MSMNLAFKTRVGNHYVEFPYQTSTDITYAVLNAPTTQEKLEILYNDISEFNGDKKLKQKVRSMLMDDTLILIMI